MGRYLTVLITFGILYYMLIMAVAPQIPTSPALADMGDVSNLKSIEMWEDAKIKEAAETGQMVKTEDRLISTPPFVISKVYGTDVPEEVIKKADLKAGDMVTEMAYRHTVGYATLVYNNVSFNVRLNDIKGDKREITTWMPSRSYVVFNPLLNEGIIKRAYLKQIGIMEKREAGLSAKELAKLTPEEMGEIERAASGIWERGARKFGNILIGKINETEVLQPIILIKQSLTYDFHISELLGITKPFKIGQVICYIWSLAVFIELFRLLPTGGTGGTVIKYIVGMGWLAFIGI